MDLPFLLPPTDDIVRHIGSSCQYSWFDGDGFGSHSQGGGAISIAGAAGVAGVAGLVSAMTVPAFSRSRGLAKRSMSASNLSQVAIACMIYANDHNGKYPDSIDTLVAGGHLIDQILESPLKPKGFAGPSYIYVAGQNADSYPENILAYENPAYSSQGVNVLHADCHVQWMGPSEFLQKLEATYTRLGKKMPQINFKSPTTKSSILGFWPLKTFNITQDK